MALPKRFLNKFGFLIKFNRGGERGVGFLLLIVSIFLVGIALSAAGVKWHTEVVREKELELLFRGDQFLSAIKAYHLDHKNKPKPFPSNLKDLLYDDTGLNPKKYLRKIYKDPFSVDGKWGLVRDKKTKGITGVYSISNKTPIKQADFGKKYKSFSGATSYYDWVFEYVAGDSKKNTKRPEDKKTNNL